VDLAFTNYQLISKVKSTIESPIKEEVSENVQVSRDILNIVNVLKDEIGELKTSIAEANEKKLSRDD